MFLGSSSFVKVRDIYAPDIPRENLHSGKGEHLVLLVEHLLTQVKLLSKVDSRTTSISFSFFTILGRQPLGLDPFKVLKEESGIYPIDNF